MRILFLALALAAAHGLGAQPVLSNREVTGVKTCLGAAEAQSVSVAVSRDVVVAVVGGTLPADDLKQLRQQVSAFFQALKNKTAFRLAAVSGEGAQFAGPFKTRTQLQQSFDELARPLPESIDAPKPLQVYSNLEKAAPQFGGDWTTVVLAGRFPAVDPELAAFTSARLADRWRTAKLHVDYWTPGEASDILEAALPAVGGTRLGGGLAPAAVSFSQPAAHWEASWTAPVPAAAFRVCPVTLTGADGHANLTLPTIAAAAGVAVPDIEQFAVLREKIGSLAAVVKQPQVRAEQAAQAEADLNAALKISPREEEALRLGATLFRTTHDDRKLAPLLTSLTELAPAEAPLFTELGHALFRMSEWDGADRALLRSRELKPGDAGVAEELARIRLTRRDDKGAIPFLEERLALAPGTQDLWLLRADAATRLGDWERNADSTEHALALGAIALDRRTALVRSYMEHQAPDKALVHVRAVAGDLPRDVAVRTEYARFLEDLKQPAEALAAWKRTLEADPKLELAHYRITLLLIDKNALAEALDAADTGIQAAPASARLYLAKAEALEKLDRFYDARETLRNAAPALPDPSLVGRLAEMEDAGGEQAARYYRVLAEADAKSGGPAPERDAALRHGLQAALRDGDLETAAWFQDQLGVVPAAAAARARTGEVQVPGGLQALSFIARSRPSSPERFLVEYARAVAQNLDRRDDKKSAEAYSEGIREHFRRVGELTASGTAGGGFVTVKLDARDANGQKNAEKLLGLLGWKMQTSRQGVKLEPAEERGKAAHLETATALAIDEIGMQQAIEAGKPFSFKVPVETAGVLLGEEPWKAQFYPKERYAGGLAEAISGNLQLAQIYAALGEMDPGTATELVSALGLKALAEKYAELLAQYGSSLAVERGRVAVPGGEPAAAIWAKLAGANPSQPGAFFKALLSRDDGKLLAYYAALSQLDIQRQRFFTRTQSRTGKFYDEFKNAPETQRSASKHINSGSFVQFLSAVPLNGDGSVDFPGSPEVWMVARGQSSSAGNTAKMMKKVKRVAAPEVEDEILLRLAGTRYKDLSQQRGELDNFLAVVRIDEHRKDPLDEASALLLAQHYAEDGAAYPYFAILTGLGQKQFEQFFALTGALAQVQTDERAAQLAPLDSLIEIVCLAQQSGAIGEAQGAELFGRMVERFQKSATPALRTAAALDLVREVLAHAGPNAPKEPDAAMQAMVLGPEPGAADLPPAQTRAGRYRQVLDLQKVPTLAAVLALYDASRNLAEGKGTPEAEIHTLETRAAELTAVEVPKELGLKGKEKELVEAFDPRRPQEIAKQFREKTAKKKVKLQDLEKLSQEYLEAIYAPVRWALEGIVYARFLRPDDLVVSEDPLLLRKHQFVELDQVGKTHVFGTSDFKQSSEKAGSYFTGVFAGFADAAGQAAALSAKLGGDYGAMVAGKQIGAIRSTYWAQLRDQDLRLLGLSIAVAREWVVRAASDPELEAGLAEATFGLLSLTRRAELLGAMRAGDWRSVWNVVTLSDLYFLAGRYLERYAADPWHSPATEGLRRESARNDGARLQLLGAELADSLGCAHPHLHASMPYEEYEKDLLPARLAERSAEFKLYLARYADTAGLPASSLEPVAEAVARGILKRMQLSDIHDWRSVLAGFSEIDGKLIQEAAAR